MGMDSNNGQTKREYLQRSEGSSSPLSIPIKADGKEKRPAEVFRTDFITAMKVPDSHVLPVGKTYNLIDTWRQEWEKGVQVPVNSDTLPTSSVRKKMSKSPVKRYDAFCLPKKSITCDNPEFAHSSEKNGGCTYDLDDLDVRWLGLVKSSSKKCKIDEGIMEKAMTHFERQCFETMAHTVATKKGLSIEYDETTTCDVCLSPDTEENNEIVFCDACNMCAHQACYGIPDIPSGTWLCRPCRRGILSPPCIICPNRGGAMKRIKDSYEWIHVICAWWVPEVKIEDIENVEKMSVNKIPASRKNLICYLCRQKMGACIQCSVKRCVTAYHVTCGVKEGLEMKTVMMQDKDDVQHISYCKRHCVAQPQESPKHRTGENIENQRLQELQKLQESFYKLVNVGKSSKELRIDRQLTRKLFAYWILKRKANDNKPLIPLTTEQQEKLSGKQGIFLIQEQINVEMESYAVLRQDLERLRNLCYLIIRRERVKREVHKSCQQVFYKQNEILNDDRTNISAEDLKEITLDPVLKFRKFPNYSPDGPPYADHLHDITSSEPENHLSDEYMYHTAQTGSGIDGYDNTQQGEYTENILRTLYGRESPSVIHERNSDGGENSNCTETGEYERSEQISNSDTKSGFGISDSVHVVSKDGSKSMAEDVPELREENTSESSKSHNIDSDFSSELNANSNSNGNTSAASSRNDKAREDNLETVNDSINSKLQIEHEFIGESCSKSSITDKILRKRSLKTKGHECAVVIKRYSPRLKRENREFDRVVHPHRKRGRPRKLDLNSEPKEKTNTERVCFSSKFNNDASDKANLMDSCDKTLKYNSRIQNIDSNCEEVVDKFTSKEGDGDAKTCKLKNGYRFFTDKGINVNIDSDKEISHSGSLTFCVSGRITSETSCDNRSSNEAAGILDRTEASTVLKEKHEAIGEEMSSTIAGKKVVLNQEKSHSQIDQEIQNNFNIEKAIESSSDQKNVCSSTKILKTKIADDYVKNKRRIRSLPDFEMENIIVIEKQNNFASDKIIERETFSLNCESMNGPLEEKPIIQDGSKKKTKIKSQKINCNEQKNIEIDSDGGTFNKSTDKNIATKNHADLVAHQKVDELLNDVITVAVGEELEELQKNIINHDKEDDTISKFEKKHDLSPCLSPRNPIVFLNHLSVANKVSTNESLPKFQSKKRRNSEVANLTYGTSVIDELLECPQRLTRQRTHLMMAAGHDREVTNNHDNALHSQQESSLQNMKTDSLSSSILTEPFLLDQLTACPQRLTRRRTKSLSSSKFNDDINNFGFSNNFAINQNCHNSNRHSKRRTSKDVFMKTSSIYDPLTEFVACPQRLTRARIRSLGLNNNERLLPR